MRPVAWDAAGPVAAMPLSFAARPITPAGCRSTRRPDLSVAVGGRSGRDYLANTVRHLEELGIAMAAAPARGMVARGGPELPGFDPPPGGADPAGQRRAGRPASSSARR
jgi:hypothetical protein